MTGLPCVRRRKTGPALAASRQPRRALLPALAWAVLSWAGAAAADPPSVSVTHIAELRFGSFLVFGSGSRLVGPSGQIIDSQIYPTPAEPAGPAQFTVSYDRGNESRRPLRIVIELALSAAPPVVLGGINAALSNFTSDLPGGGVLAPGQVVTVTLDNCTQRVCSRTFRIGGRIDVHRSWGAGRLTFPLLVDAAVVAVD